DLVVPHLLRKVVVAVRFAVRDQHDRVHLAGDAERLVGPGRRGEPALQPDVAGAAGERRLVERVVAVEELAAVEDRPGQRGADGAARAAERDPRQGGDKVRLLGDRRRPGPGDHVAARHHAAGDEGAAVMTAVEAGARTGNVGRADVLRIVGDHADADR